ncbi:ribbon-helix-helix protein, CopG family, partial [uncultured Parasutterella sp.]
MDRITISLDEELSQAFDKYVTSEGYKNRSEAIRDLIQEKLLEVQL